MLSFLSSCFGTGSKVQNSSSDAFLGTIKYINNKLGKMQEGVSFTITGHIIPTGSKFRIDFGLDNTSKDIALRLDISVTENIVTRNAKVDGSWGEDESDTVIPFIFDPNSEFQVQVLFTIECIMVAVDGFHTGKFVHRAPFHDIRNLTVKGDVQEIHVRRKIVTEYPEYVKKSKHFVSISEGHIKTGVYDTEDYSSTEEEKAEAILDAIDARRPMPLPYYASFPKGFFDMGYSMSIIGQVTSNARSFSASLQSGHHTWPQPVVTLFLEFQFISRGNGETGEPLVIRKSFYNGRWSNEEISELATGVRTGSDFNLLIYRGNTSFEIFINEKPITEYPYVVNPRNVDILLVTGDILLFNIEIEEND